MTLKLALIPPVELLDYTERTNYQLALPLRDEKAYVNKFRKLSDRGDYIILDNGVAEGWDFTPLVLADYAGRIGASEIVLQDALGSAVATVELTRKSLYNYTDMYGLHEQFNYMAVPQGKNPVEFKWCVQQFVQMNSIKVLGIPRHMIKTCKDPYARVEFARWVLTQFPYRFTIHFLGMDGDYPYEAWHIFNEFHTHKSVRGLDTSLPFNYAFAGESISHPKEAHHRPENYFNLKPEAFNTYVLEYNVNKLKEWLHT